MTRENRSRRSLKKSDGAKSNGNDLLLTLKRGKAVKDRQKHMKNMIFFSGKLFVFESVLFELRVKSDKSNSLKVANF